MSSCEPQSQPQPRLASVLALNSKILEERSALTRSTNQTVDPYAALGSAPSTGARFHAAPPKRPAMPPKLGPSTATRPVGDSEGSKWLLVLEQMRRSQNDELAAEVQKPWNYVMPGVLPASHMAGTHKPDAYSIRGRQTNQAVMQRFGGATIPGKPALYAPDRDTPLSTGIISPFRNSDFGPAISNPMRAQMATCLSHPLETVSIAEAERRITAAAP
jgi:hypothetical protein